MNGSNINAAATGLMQGIQFMDERRRRDKQDARQDRMDTLAEQRESRRAEIDGLTLQQKQAEMADYQADAPMRQQDRAEKQRQYDARLNRQEADQLMMGLEKEWETTQSMDNSLRAINDRIGDGLDYVGSSVDPKTGKITIQRTDPDTGLAYENTYASMRDLQNKTRAYMGDEEAWRANWQSRIAEAEKLVAKQEKETTDAREHERKLEEIEAQGKNSATVARINQEGRMDLLEFKRDFESRNGTGKVMSQADRGKLAIEWAGEIAKTVEGMKMSPAARLAEAKKQVDSLYPSPAPAAAAGVTPPAAAPKPAQQKKGPVPVIDFSQFRM